jgi:dGTPase
MDDLTDRAKTWASTMGGNRQNNLVVAHADSSSVVSGGLVRGREAREEAEDAWFAPEATRGDGAGRRALLEEPDPLRTCFERDRDRILHCASFRRLAGKTQAFVSPDDHMRTRLTHAIEVSQVGGAVARALRLNVSLTEAIALGHDCGHGPGGHASEDALSPYVSGGYDHAIWGADVALAPLNLCVETLDGVRNHSW